MGKAKIRASARIAHKDAADFSREASFLARGFVQIAGVDEAGRGPLAGPVSAAAVILDPDRIPDGLADSKTLSEARRAALFEQICATATVSVAFASAGTIDRMNIRQASLDAMARAVCGLSVAADFALIDGRDIPGGLSIGAQAVIGGDGKSLSIAAASIVAKVMRDRLMMRCETQYSGYGFSGHKGYGTQVHRDAIARLGPCALHRMTFAPLKTRQGSAGKD
jgi:ribonuclease HII